jgi:hypothetical protein
LPRRLAFFVVPGPAPDGWKACPSSEIDVRRSTYALSMSGSPGTFDAVSVAPGLPSHQRGVALGLAAGGGAPGLDGGEQRKQRLAIAQKAARLGLPQRVVVADHPRRYQAPDRSVGRRGTQNVMTRNH